MSDTTWSNDDSFYYPNLSPTIAFASTSSPGRKQFVVEDLGDDFVAVEEPADVLQNLIQNRDNDINSNTSKQRKAKSAHLLKKELENQGKVASREFLIKVKSVAKDTLG